MCDRQCSLFLARSIGCLALDIITGHASDADETEPPSFINDNDFPRKKFAIILSLQPTALRRTII
jgi:hypothetical protein